MWPIPGFGIPGLQTLSIIHMLNFVLIYAIVNELKAVNEI